METYPQYAQGDNLIILDGKLRRYGGDIPRMNPLALVDVGMAVKLLDWMASSVPLEAPWEAEKAHQWDSETIGAWIDSRLHVTTDAAQKLLRSTAEAWSRGDMFAHYAPGVLTGFGRAMREPCGRIHWSGTETATHWVGSIEGAVLSGERVAAEVLEASA